MNVRGPARAAAPSSRRTSATASSAASASGPPLALPYALPAAGTAAPSCRVAEAACPRCPSPLQTASTFAAIALGFGVVVGTAISPNLAGIVAAPSPDRGRAGAAARDAASSPSAAAAAAARRRRGGRGPRPPSPRPARPPAAVAAVAEAEAASKKKKQKEAAGHLQRRRSSGVNPVAQSYTICLERRPDRDPRSDTLPAGRRPASTFPVRKLKNGTYAEQGIAQPIGTEPTTASFLGTVTYCADLEQPAALLATARSPGSDHFVYSVSSLGASVLVSSPSGTPLPPQVGAQVQVGVHIGNPFTPIDPVPTTGLQDLRRTLQPLRQRAERRCRLRRPRPGA